MKNKINFSLLPGNLLYAFVRSLLAIVTESKLGGGLLSSLLAKVNTILADFSKGFERDSNDPLTKLAIEKDELRDRYFNGLKSYVKSVTYSSDQIKANVANILVDVIRKHGWSAASFSFDKESAAITSLINELAEKHPRQVALLGLQESWITPLSVAQQEFEQIQKQRVELGAIDVPTVSKYRQPLIRAVRKLINTLETAAEESSDVQLKELASQVDELIGRTMATLKATATRGENNTKPESEPAK